MDFFGKNVKIKVKLLMNNIKPTHSLIWGGGQNET